LQSKFDKTNKHGKFQQEIQHFVVDYLFFWSVTGFNEVSNAWSNVRDGPPTDPGFM